MRFKRRAYSAFFKLGTVTALTLTQACGGSNTSKPQGSLTLSQAFCNDLRSGNSPFQIYGGVKDQYTPEKFADLAYGFAKISCPEELASNEFLRTYLQNWNINPDL